MEWKPISSAPKDGTPILLLCEDWQYPIDEGDIEPQSPCVAASWHEWMDDGQGGHPWLMCNIEFCEVAGKPTHWMPLPPPPEQET